MSSKAPKKGGAPPGLDIRSFFGGGSSQSKAGSSQPKPSQQSDKKGGVKRKVESDDDEPPPPKKKAAPAKEIISIDDSDDEKPKPKAKAAVAKKKSSALLSSDDDESTPKKASTSKARPSAAKAEPPAKAAPKRKTALLSSDDDDAPPKKKATPAKKPAAKPRKSAAKKDDDYSAGSSAEEEVISAKAKGKKPAAPKKAAKPVAVEDTDSEDEAPKKKPAPKKSKKDAFIVDDDEDDDDDLIPSKSKAKKPAPKKKAPVKKEEAADGDEDKPKKFNFYAHKAAKMAMVTHYGSKEMPEGSEDCLAGLSFVFTGELPSFSREDAIAAAKRFGGRVVGQPSTRTDYVVLGENAGPAKLAAIQKHGIKTMDEDAFLKLIRTRTGTGEIDDKTKKKMEKEQQTIMKEAKEMEKREKKEAKVQEKQGKGVDLGMQLWTTRYAPQTLKEVCGNKSQVEKLLLWLQEWPQRYKEGFRKPGKNLNGIFRAVLITGSPGIGKTTSAHLCAKLAGYTPIELNASDARSKKLVESGMNINNTSLDGYIGNSKTNSFGIDITDKTCLIMDEVDGMSAGDRGGVGALNALIKKTKVGYIVIIGGQWLCKSNLNRIKIPIICIANDKGAQKLKPLLATTFSMPFHKPATNQVRSRIMSIAYKEGMELSGTVVDQLVGGAQSDIRQVLNMLSTWKLSNSTMNFDEGKVLTKMNEKYQILSPFDITSKMLGPYMFSPNEKKTLGDKMEMYFQDHSFVPLFIQENYLKGTPAQIRNLDGPEKTLKTLQLMDKAASSLSDGDLVDNMIHGPEQHWSLMPLHAVCSTVRPASFMYGQGAHYGGPNGMAFPAWLGNNSKQTKLNRQLADVQIKMRLKVSGDKHEVRQQYIPALYGHLIRPLIDEGADAVEEVIERMDAYYLNKEDWDAVVELGVDTRKDDLLLKKIPTQVKSAFTRKYNAGDHPIAYHKALDIGKVPKKLAGAGEKPDLEDAFDMDEEVADGSEDEDEQGSGGGKKGKKGKGGGGDGIEGDKMIQMAKPKKKAAPRKSAAK